MSAPDDLGRLPSAPGCQPSASAPLRGSSRSGIPSAGDVFTIVYPFVRDTYTELTEDGPCETATWKPGINYVQVSEDHAAPVADAVGQAIFTVVGVFKPGRFPTRVFYTRKFFSPSGHEFGNPKLHIATLDKFRRLTRGYQHPFGIGKPLLSDHQWWRKADAEREFFEVLAQHATASADAQ
jgi:hypothetical protein